VYTPEVEAEQCKKVPQEEGQCTKVLQEEVQYTKALREEVQYRKVLLEAEDAGCRSVEGEMAWASC